MRSSDTTYATVTKIHGVILDLRAMGHVLMSKYPQLRELEQTCVKEQARRLRDSYVLLNNAYEEDVARVVTEELDEELVHTEANAALEKKAQQMQLEIDDEEIPLLLNVVHYEVNCCLLSHSHHILITFLSLSLSACSK